MNETLSALDGLAAENEKPWPSPVARYSPVSPLPGGARTAASDGDNAAAAQWEDCAHA